MNHFLMTLEATYGKLSACLMPCEHSPFIHKPFTLGLRVSIGTYMINSTYCSKMWLIWFCMWNAIMTHVHWMMGVEILMYKYHKMSSSTFHLWLNNMYIVMSSLYMHVLWIWIYYSVCSRIVITTNWREIFVNMEINTAEPCNLII